MSNINKSQQFVYFQNKARHYDNIKKIKPAINDKLQNSYLKTINHSPNQKKRFSPYLREYQVQDSNQRLITRLVNIVKSPRSEVKASGNYSRYNEWKRPFRQSKQYKRMEEKSLKTSNIKMAQRLISCRPKIGTLNQWNRHFTENLNHRRNSSRYNLNQRVKGDITISTQRFIPQHYKSFITKDQKSLSRKKTITLSKQKMLELPYILKRQNSESPTHRLLNQKSRSTLNNNNDSNLNLKFGKDQYQIKDIEASNDGEKSSKFDPDIKE